MLTPASASSPRPSDSRRSISAASGGWLATISRRASFSNQRKPGMPSFRPWRIPAWLAGVHGGSSGCQPPTSSRPSRTRRPSTGQPARRQQPFELVAAHAVHLDDDQPGGRHGLTAVRDLRACVRGRHARRRTSRSACRRRRKRMSQSSDGTSRRASSPSIASTSASASSVGVDGRADDLDPVLDPLRFGARREVGGGLGEARHDRGAGEQPFGGLAGDHDVRRVHAHLQVAPAELDHPIRQDVGDVAARDEREDAAGDLEQERRRVTLEPDVPATQDGFDLVDERRRSRRAWPRSGCGCPPSRGGRCRSGGRSRPAAGTRRSPPAGS